MFRKSLLGLIGCLLLSFLLLAYPLYVLRPFRYQGPRELSAALAVMRLRPFLEVILVITALMFLIWVWRTTPRISRKIVALLCFLAVASCGVLSRVNVYELLFHPLDKPSFSPAPKTSLDGREQVIAINVNGAARAYPIRIISYHHLVNDVVGGVPIIATY